MSKRNDITNNIVAVLKDTTDPKPIFVTREIIDPNELARTQFPAVVVVTGDETRSESTMSASNSRRSVMNIICRCFVTGTEIDRLRNDIIERVEEALEVDRTRDGNAEDTRLVEVAVDEAVDKRFGLATMTFEVEYTYTRGAA
tara:strand:- start:1020 stop:1448 length:429 start_codon:yes stop_codon:yes gene_type:complete